MADRNFMQLLQARWDEGKFVCVGLDSEAARIQKLDENFGLRGTFLWDKVVSFNEDIVDATKDLVCAYKTNSAFYEALGVDGGFVLRDTIDYIHTATPGVPVILDFKRGDIGNTNNGYVEAAKAADAVTISPYFGLEAMRPFLDNPNKGAIVLCRTSNPGAGEFQDLDVVVYRNPQDDYVYSSVEEANRELHGEDPNHEDLATADFERVIMPMYEFLALRVEQSWNYNGNCCLVAGATHPNHLATIRDLVGGDIPLLILGIGAQGAELEATVKAGANSEGQGMIINSSRDIIFALEGRDFADAARSATQALHDSITAALAA